MLSLVLVVLSIELDSNDQLVRLSADRFLVLQELIASWRSSAPASNNYWNPSIVIFIIQPRWSGPTTPFYAL